MYDLSNPSDRMEYFEEKVGEEISAIKKYLESNSFVAYLLAKKMAGKGTYATMLREVFGEEKIAHVSVGDLVRDAENMAVDEKGARILNDWLKKNYSGGFRVDDLIEMLRNHEFSKYYPTGMIISLLERAIHDCRGKALLIDGFPRTLDQIENSLKFTELIDYRPDPDFFVHIECPEEVILERYKGRRVCPKCSSTGHITLLPKPGVKYDEEKKEYILLCDNPACNKEPLIKKQADELGAQYVEKRNSDTQELMDEIKKYTETGSSILLKNAVPVEGFVGEDYEVTKITEYSRNETSGEITRTDKPWIMKDNDGVDCYSYYPAAVVKDFIRQLANKLELM